MQILALKNSKQLNKLVTMAGSIEQVCEDLRNTMMGAMERLIEVEGILLSLENGNVECYEKLIETREVLTSVFNEARMEYEENCSHLVGGNSTVAVPPVGMALIVDEFSM